MRICYLLKCAVAQMYNRIHSTVFVLAVLVVSYMILEYALLIMMPQCLGELVAEHVFTGDCEDIVYLGLWKYGMASEQETKDVFRLVETVRGIEGVEGAGIYFLQDQEMFPVFFVSQDITYLSDMRDISGKAIDFSYEGDLQGVAVGYALSKKYPVGSVIEISSDSQNRCIVTQVLKKGSYWLDEDVGTGAYINLDTRIIADADCYIKENPWMIVNGLNSICYAVGQGYDRAEMKEKVARTAADMGLDLYSQRSIAEKLADAKRNIWDEKEEFIMPLVLIILAMVSMIVSSMVTIYLRKPSLGILYAVGFSHRDIMRMYVMENIVKVLLAHALASAYWIVNQRTFLATDESISVMWMIEPVMLAADVLLVVFGSMAPLQEIKKTDLAKLIEGERI